MKIGLIDVDGHNFPSLPLMKISAFHKGVGDDVEMCFPLARYDIVYMSKVFTFSPDIDWQPQADIVYAGGTGYPNSSDRLAQRVEHIYPDYSLYPQHKEAYGFLTRGCPRGCPWCVVPTKEGCKSHQVADLSEFWGGQKAIKLLDPNLLACPDREQLLRQLIKSRAWVDFTQGLDIRMVDKDCIQLLNQVRSKMLHFAWDNPREDLTAKFDWFRQTTEITDYRKLGVYILTNYNSSHEEDLWRIYTLRDLGYSPYVMIYDKQHAPRQTRLLQRWVNNRIIFKSVPRFNDYDERIG